MTPPTCTPESIASAKADAEATRDQLRHDGVPLEPDGSITLKHLSILPLLLQQDHAQITALQTVIRAVEIYGEERVLIWVKNAKALGGAA